MSNPEANIVVFQYLKSVAPKFAKKLQKQLNIPEEETNFGLIQLLEFYKSRNQPTDAEEVEIIKPVKKGKKRKLSERDNEIIEILPNKPTKKKKKKKQEVTSNGHGHAEEQESQTKEKEVEEIKEVVQLGGGMVGDTGVNGEESGNMDAEISAKQKKKNKKEKRQQNLSFRRVKEEDVVIKNTALTDNSFDAKNGADGYGFKANQILKYTKGKSFRHEKTKKKRGTYKGGVINMGVTSVKFASDSD